MGKGRETAPDMLRGAAAMRAASANACNFMMLALEFVLLNAGNEVHVSVEMEHHSKNIDKFWRDVRDWIDKVFL